MRTRNDSYIFAPRPTYGSSIHEHTVLFVLNSPVELNSVEEKVNFLSKLKCMKDNWDGYGAVAPSETVINNTINFLYSMPHLYQKMLSVDELSPTPYGTVLLDWQNGENDSLSIEIGRTSVGFISETKLGEIAHEESIQYVSNKIPEEIMRKLKHVFAKAASNR